MTKMSLFIAKFRSPPKTGDNSFVQFVTECHALIPALGAKSKIAENLHGATLEIKPGIQAHLATPGFLKAYFASHCDLPFTDGQRWNAAHTALPGM
jgi:hypothetical protein